MTASLDELIRAKRAFGTRVCQRISESIANLGFSVQIRIDLPNYDAAQFSLVTDPYTQSQDLVGHWFDQRKQRIGQIQFLGDGSVYAEYDIIQPHPGKKQYFVESINAWGVQDNIKTEAKLLAMP